jgi:hypothetical protein
MLTQDDVWGRDEEIAWREANNRPWKVVNGLLLGSGDPLMVAGGLAGLEANPPAANVGANTYASSTEIALWPTGQSPIPALQVGPKAYYVVAWGTATTAGTPGTMTTTARFGGITSGVSIAATPAVALTASMTADPWRLEGDLILRNTGVTTMVVTGSFRLSFGIIGGNGAESLPELFNGVSGSCDNTAASTLCMGVSMATSTTNTTACNGVIFGSWN